ncbi:hypothetical protein [Paraburkholderia caffeinilytica]|uniref:hypothetical protein n=1 Tax=Paraburkholderia caffeinilytica TaxID=1761016 RepID=UPI003DA046F5
MANTRLAKCKIRDVLRLYFECSFSQRQIGDLVGTSITSVWRDLRSMRLYPLQAPREPERGALNCAVVHRELGRKSIAPELLR